jgi:D-arabinan exo alpha-(1,3)/(1,5)-arabinofuranosidase (non-reducing end)
MPVLPLVLGLLLAAADPTLSGPVGYRPSGSSVDLHDLARLALLRDPDVHATGFSSYDRTGGNNDGFRGTYSRLREEDGNSVLAEAAGPGVIQRIWFTHSVERAPGLLARKGEHIRIYLDGQSAPALDMPLEDFFRGRHPRFPKPLVGEGSGGFVCYVPIAFRNGCKVVVAGLDVRFYQINLISLPSAEGVTTFTASITPDERAQLDQAVNVWSHPGDFAALGIRGAEKADYTIDAIGHTSLTFELPDGPRTVRSLEFVPTDDTAEAWRSARLRLLWETDEPAEAGVDLPIGYAFGQAFGSQPYRSLVVGQADRTWYLRFPMPYRRQALVRLDTELPIRGTLRVLSVPGAEAAAGYCHAHYVEALPTKPRVDFPLLTDRGRGHYAGLFLATEGRAKLPFWLEGDDRFNVDGRLAIHGTGTEDYFNCGWYALKGRLDGPATYPSHGFPVYRQDGDTHRVAAYRWHLADPVPYAQSIEAGLEHGEVNLFEADYRAAVFWYSERPGPRPSGG